VVRLVKGANYAAFSPAEVFLQAAPLAFDASTFEIWGALLHGARLAVMPPGQPTLEQIGQAIRVHKVTTLWLTTGLFQMMVEERVSDLKPLRQLLTGGDIISVAHMRRAFQELPDCRLINCYGPTESTTFTSTYLVGPQTCWDRSLPIGRPIANTQVFILDAMLEPTPIGVAGELYIGGDGLARGYLRRPELTQEKFIPNPFGKDSKSRLYKTGDLARYLADGNIEFLGRRDNQVKIRGFRIELGEIESVLAGLPGVSEAVVLAREDVPGDKQLVAYLTGKEGELPNIPELRGLLKAKLPDHMVPLAFVTLDRFLLTPNGKVDRKALPKPDFEPAADRYAPPATPTEIALAKIWSEVLGVKQIGLHDNFFELGGHSLLATKMVSRIRSAYPIDLTLVSLFENPTLAGLAAVIDRQCTEEMQPDELSRIVLELESTTEEQARQSFHGDD
jgi:aspartate racemase